MQESYEDLPVSGSNRPEQAWQFVNQMEQVLGEGSEPDPMFFVESWTIGVPAAVENFMQRRPGQRNLQGRNSAFDRFGNLETLSFVQESESDGDFLTSARVAAIADSYIASWPQQFAEEAAATAYGQPSPAREAFADERASGQESGRPMTLEGACRLLRVSISNSHEQIRAAYRHMASLYHPDRVANGTEEERQLGTDRMAAINEAYRLLSSGMI
jgi:DnaJ-domain-containing protein 1